MSVLHPNDIDVHVHDGDIIHHDSGEVYVKVGYSLTYVGQAKILETSSTICEFTFIGSDTKIIAPWPMIRNILKILHMYYYNAAMTTAEASEVNEFPHWMYGYCALGAIHGPPKAPND